MMTMIMVTTVATATFLDDLFLQEEHFSLNLSVAFPVTMREDECLRLAVWEQLCKLWEKGVFIA